MRVAGVPIGSLTTDAAGSGRARFSTVPRTADQPLGVDPRGQEVEVADDQGEDELDGDIPDDSSEPCCCVEDDQGENEGEEMDPSQCPGTVPGAPSCLPDPCNDDGVPIVCCIPDSEGPQCEQASAAECSDESGVNLGPGSCDPNPCAPPSPPVPVAPCCVPDDEGTGSDCEVLTAAHCDEEHGTAPIGAVSCEPNPCP